MNQTILRIRECISYDAESGEFTFKKCIGRKIRAGDKAGFVNSHGYLIITLDGIQHRASRLAFAIVTGEFPCSMVDHKNGVISDNSWGNLREATRSQNGMNSKISTRNTSGVKCVSWDKTHKKWKVLVTKNKKRYHGGSFDDLSMAAERAAELRSALHADFARHE